MQFGEFWCICFTTDESHLLLLQHPEIGAETGRGVKTEQNGVPFDVKNLPGLTPQKGDCSGKKTGTDGHLILKTTL